MEQDELVFQAETPTKTEQNDDESSRHHLSDSRDSRQYLKDVLITHPLWKEARFWEQALWQCVLEQVGGWMDGWMDGCSRCYSTSSSIHYYVLNSFR